MNIIVFTISAVILVACYNAGREEASVIFSDLATIPGHILKEIPVGDLENVTGENDTLKQYPSVFVISPEGAEARMSPSDDAETKITYPYGERLMFESETGDWYKVVKQHDRDLQVYVKKKDAVPELEIPLTRGDINESFGEEGTESILSIDLITKEEFYKKKKSSKENFTAEGDVSKVDDVLTLKTAKGVKIFRDNFNGFYGTYYYYEGQFKSLNAYLVEEVCQECEEYRYILIDKTTGWEIQSFPSVPVLSGDKKSMICISTERAYSGSEQITVASSDFAGVSLYSVNKDTIKQKNYRVFPKWALANSVSGFWGSDNYLYAAILPSFANWEIYGYWSEDKREGTEYNYRYIRIKISQSLKQ